MGYSVTIQVTPNTYPGHIALIIKAPATQDAPASQTFMGFGPDHNTTMVEITRGAYGAAKLDVHPVPFGQTPNTPDGEANLQALPPRDYYYNDYSTAIGHSFESFTIPISQAQAKAIIDAANDLSAHPPNYNLAAGNVCSKIAAQLLRAGGVSDEAVSFLPSQTARTLGEIEQALAPITNKSLYSMV